MRYTGLFLLGFWLIADGVVGIFKLHFFYDRMILSGLELSSGIVLLLSTIKVKPREFGILLLAVWLLIGGGITLFKFTFPNSSMVLAMIGVAAGLLMVFRK